MQHIENDMDDLFKRAAENYPLQAGDGDWKNVLQRISDKPENDIVPPPKNNKNKKILAVFLLLLMLPAGWLIVRNYLDDRAPSFVVENNDNKGKGDNQRTPPVQEDELNVSPKEKSVTGLSGVDDKSYHPGKPILKNSRNILLQVIAPGADSLNADARSGAADNTGAADQLSAVNADNNASPGEIIPSIIDHTNTLPDKVSRVSITEKNADNKGIDPLKKADSLAVPNSKKEKKAPSQKKTSIYAGIIAGPDLSRVQSMSFSNTGVNAGVVAGINIGRKVAFETGITWNKKYYDSKGKDFSMDKVGPSMNGMTIDDLAGQSSLIEIPVKIKYDLVSRRASAFYVAGGVSAYIMTREKNNYNVTMNGNRQKVTAIYNKNNYGVPAVATFSIGYEHHVAAGLHIRVEPILKIPLKGIGVGSLPITSTGLQIGIISRLK